MKTYKDMTEEILKKRNQYRAKRTRYIKIASGLTTGLLICFIGIALNHTMLISNSSSQTGIDYTGTIANEKTYEDVYENMMSVLPQKQNNMVANGIQNEMLADGRAAAEDSLTGTGASTDYSDTNLQVIGVQEADIIKTDGKYIYAYCQNTLYIVEANNGVLKLVSSIKGPNTNQLNKYVYDGSASTNAYYGGTKEMYLSENYVVIINITSVVEAQVFDITNPGDPILLNKYTQEGDYLSSRMIGADLYLVTQKYVNTGDIDKKTPSTFVPRCGIDDKFDLVAPEDIYINTEFQDSYVSNYIVVGGIHLSKDTQELSSIAIFGCGNNIYSSLENMYIAAGYNTTKNQITSDYTKIYRISIKDGKVFMAAEGTVFGTVLNQFSMDEYEGTFRIVTTSYRYNMINFREFSTVNSSSSIVNALYTLDQDLNIVGKLEDVAPGERVYSVRFDGATGYFVTFRKVDPLFTVDLSDPKNPMILSALKIPGFSEYMHSYADGFLFGLGRYADPQTGRTKGLKLSMFDTKDATNVIEASSLVISEYNYSPAEYNHKAILINSVKNIIGFPVQGGKYLIFSYDYNQKKFVKNATLTASDNPKTMNTRGIFIGNYLYLYDSLTGIKSYAMDGYTLTANFKFQ
ncbi:beta-propeller domain-containing protein [[Clostridium] fimetarium]|uniref:Secreted protein containing C-terminal beta-propeller domain n=1 Tax=[Clostridium] fimetarium TaxID=99656 RepID=A0A1I0PDN1_9FIRM|nr:beta-propeller domain-containing protein [[Clostridium] fimetarium]SEW12528.1 Secreted protein containing C-terminal beta-propeller domain [[Clostridium] fimetarium]